MSSHFLIQSPDAYHGFAAFRQNSLRNISEEAHPMSNSLWRKLEPSSGRTQQYWKTVLNEGINVSNAPNATDVVRRALSSLAEFRFRTDQQEAEWRNYQVSFLLGAGNCIEVCAGARGGARACARDWFVHLDQCAVARAVFTQGRCVEVPRPSAPGYDGRRREVLVSAFPRIEPPSCEALPAPEDTRLCPCTPTGNLRPPPAAPGLAGVRQVIAARLLAEEGGREAARRNESEEEAAAAAVASMSAYSSATLLRSIQEVGRADCR